MRKRTIFAMLAAATALGGLAAPAAQADGYGDTTITNVTVDGGGKVAIGTTGAKTFKVAVTASDDSGVKRAEFYLDGPSYGYLQPDAKVKCVASATDATTSTCTGTFTVDPAVDFVDNAPAGTWYVSAWIDAKDGDYFTSGKAGSFAMQRLSKLTVDASPEPVKKGKTLTVTGALTRANWETSAYAGYTNQPAQLQFRKRDSDTYTTLKTVNTGSRGALKTTVTATEDGWYRWTFAGTSTTPPATAGGDFIDVQ
ncbi:Ig-like domain-containing protein [Streptomyces sp. ME19-01-6]|uniref:Ig-like domain-containing protein n=1 Tax=Streptomyces sp. ME19-01-6 TaxID=3028686 RepID=UPI0029A42DF5|nr:Ig-like domain-containing protein [Streptomyces sp. ME19-01-6]MDX3227322.1 Ig-like domain-containing protein [Streptomyces sp. ME19-01-6]